MKLHRFIGNFDLSQKEVEITDLQIIKQIRNVLRLEVGDMIILSTGRGQEAEVALNLVSSDKVAGEISKLVETKEAGKKVHLYLAILKKENFELAVQKAVECGVSTITPIITERTVKTGLNISRLEKIILEASEQSGRSVVPMLSPILDFSPALAFGSAAAEKTIFHLCDELYDPETNRVASAKTASIFIGPEGGFTDKEVTEAESCGFTVASLGSLTLRGETAAIIATYRAVHGV
jgi:16S rRNA (uracil1498-N3)-methyltransferase